MIKTGDIQTPVNPQSDTLDNLNFHPIKGCQISTLLRPTTSEFKLLIFVYFEIKNVQNVDVQAFSSFQKTVI